MLTWFRSSPSTNRFMPSSSPDACTVYRETTFLHSLGGVEMWRGGSRRGISVSAPFGRRCLTSLAVAPFPHPAHRTGRAGLPHPALGQDRTPSHTAGSAVRDASEADPGSGRDTEGNRLGIHARAPCASDTTTGAAASPCKLRVPDTPCRRCLL